MKDDKVGVKKNKKNDVRVEQTCAGVVEMRYNSNDLK